MAERGRLTKLTPERRDSILRDLRKGNTRACSAERAGVSERTLCRWLAAGRRGEKGGWVAFLSAVKKAERDAERRMVGIIRTSSRKTWTAAAWWLERKLPTDWGDQRDVVQRLTKALKEVEALRDQLTQAAPASRTGEAADHPAGGDGTAPSV